MSTPKPTSSAELYQTVLDNQAFSPVQLDALKEKLDLSSELKEVLISYTRSEQARELEQSSTGKIVLRQGGRIDFPQMNIKGATRLSSKAISNPESGIIQGNYVDQYTSKGTPRLTYLTGAMAMQEAKKQNLTLFKAQEAEWKTKQLLHQLGVTSMEQAMALQALFGPEFSGYWHPFLKKRTTVGGSIAYVAMSEIDQRGNVSAIEWSKDDANQCRNYQHSPQPFIAFEEC